MDMALNKMLVQPGGQASSKQDYESKCQSGCCNG